MLRPSKETLLTLGPSSSGGGATEETHATSMVNW